MKKLILLFLMVLVSTPINAQYLTEDFETAWTGTPPAPLGWTQTRIRAVFHSTAERDWVRNTWTGSSWSISSSGTNPSGAYSGTGVAWIDDYNYMSSSIPQAASRLESPVVDLSSSTSPYIRFWYFNNQAPGITMNLRIMVSSNGGSTWDVLTPIVNGFTVAVNTWNRISVAIPAPYRTANFKFAFEITNRWGTNNPFIDLVTVEEFTPTTITSAGSGDWNAVTTWVGGVVPTADHNVIIAAGHTVTMPTTTNIIGRCQNLTINGTLNYSTGTANLLHVFGNIVVNGTLNAFNGTSGRFVYCGGNFTINSGGTANFNIGTTAQSTGATFISTGASGLVWLGNQPATFTNSGTLTGGRINNILHLNPGGVTYNSPVTVPFTVGLYLGAVNPNGFLTLGNATASATQSVERANGTFTVNPTWNNTNITSRSNIYYSPNWVPLTQTTLTTGNEIEVIGGTRTISGTLTMNTHNNLQLTYPLVVGTASTGAGLTLTRGIIISDETNLLHLAQNNTSASAGTAPSTATPPTTHGSYIVGPLKRTFPSSGSISRTFPLGVGTSFNGSTPNSNVLKLVTIATGTGGANSQSPIVSIVGAPSGSAVSPLTTVMGTRAYRINLDGGPDFPSTATLTITGMNYTFGNSDNLLGTVPELRIAQATSLTGPWTERSDSSGTGTIVNNTVYSRTTSTGAPGPIAPIGTNGEYFAWATTAPIMTYSSSTTTQNTSNTPIGSTNQQVIGIQVVTTGALSPISITKFTVNANGTTNISDISNAKIFYTGTSPTFAAINQFGSTTTPNIANFDITGSQTLATGTNYFWLTFDISASATDGNLVDAECTQITVAGIDYTPTVTAPPGARTIRGPMSGTYTVGTGGIYPTLKAAFDDVNMLGLGGNVTFNIVSDITETASASLNQWVESGGSGYTLTIQPNSATMRTISGNISGALIRLNGADRVTIDGRHSGSGNFLTFTNNNNTSSASTIWINSVSDVNPATSITIRNVTVNGGGTSTLAALIVSGSTIGGTAEADNTNIQIIENIISRAQYGIGVVGPSTGQTGLIIRGNQVGSTTPANKISYQGIFISNQNGALVENNTVAGLSSSAGDNLSAGVSLVGNTTNTVVNANLINDIVNTNTSGWGTAGIRLASTATSSNIRVSNNVIYDVRGYGWSGNITDNGHGIRITSGGGYNIIHNSVILATNQTAAGQSSAILISAGSNLDIRNNIFVNQQTTGTRYSIYSSVDNTAYSNINYNNYFSSQHVGFLTSNRTTLSDWRTATGRDANSLSGDPGFTSSTNLLPNNTNVNSWNVANKGVHISTVTTDFTGASRPTTQAAGVPDIGAYEFATPTVAPPAATQSGTLAAGSTTTYSQGGQQYGSISWGPSGTVPTGITFTVYTGVAPTGGPSVPKARMYWDITQTGGSGFTYDITLNYDEAQLNGIPEGNLHPAKSDDGGTTWIGYTSIGTGPGQFQRDIANNTITVYGLTSFSFFGLGDGDNPFPVELSSFTASAKGRNIELNWQTATEVNSSKFVVERKSDKDDNWISVSEIQAAGNSNSPKDYSYIDKKLNSGSYSYRLKMIDIDGTYSYSSIVEETVELPKEYAISQNYPNPFNPSTRIDYQLPFDSKVMIELYSITGERVAMLNDKVEEAGYYTLEIDGSSLGLANGVYIYRIVAQNLSNGQQFMSVKKMMMIK